jgi:hypothetical protein
MVPFENPFAQMELSYGPKVTRAATYEELTAFVTAADALGHRSIGSAALVAFNWLQREEDIFLRLRRMTLQIACASSITRPASLLTYPFMTKMVRICGPT